MECRPTPVGRRRSRHVTEALLFFTTVAILDGSTVAHADVWKPEDIAACNLPEWCAATGRRPTEIPKGCEVSRRIDETVFEPMRLEPRHSAW
jgi:hypothetical protein